MQRQRLSGAIQEELDVEWTHDMPWQDPKRPYNLFDDDQRPRRPEFAFSSPDQYFVSGYGRPPAAAAGPTPPAPKASTGAELPRTVAGGQVREAEPRTEMVGLLTAALGLLEGTTLQRREEALQALDERELTKLAAAPKALLMTHADVWDVLRQAHSSRSAWRVAQTAVHPDKTHQSQRLTVDERQVQLRKAQLLRNLLARAEEA